MRILSFHAPCDSRSIIKTGHHPCYAAVLAFPRLMPADIEKLILVTQSTSDCQRYTKFRGTSVIRLIFNLLLRLTATPGCISRQSMVVCDRVKPLLDDSSSESGKSRLRTARVISLDGGNE